ncbi:MAG: hypothetical protein FD126_2383, partial [Elusimicrobia bacterium]
MGELFSDIWIWASAGGMLLSGAALPFLIRKARAAGTAPLAGAVSVPSHFDDEDEPIPVLKTPKAEAPAEPAPVVFPPPAAVPAAEPPDRANVTGPLGRGERFVGEIMGRMSHFESEIHDLRAQVQGFAEAHDKEFKVLLQKMGEFQGELHKELQAHASVPAAKPPASAPPPAAKPPASAPPPAAA